MPWQLLSRQGQVTIDALIDSRSSIRSSASDYKQDILGIKVEAVEEDFERGAVGKDLFIVHELAKTGDYRGITPR